jgi:hypothetical protein
MIMPESLTGRSDDNITINTLPELMVYMVRIIDELSGQYPIKVKIRDTNPNEPGNQEQTIVIPNAAELGAEMFGLSYETQYQVQMLLSMLTRLIPEIIASKNSSIVTQDFVTTITEFLGMRTKERQIDVPCNFTIANINRFEDLMKPSVSYLPGVTDADKHTVSELLHKIHTASQLAAMPNFRTKGELEDLVTEMGSVAKEAHDKPSERLDDFLDFANSQFSAQNKGSNQPRPLVRQVANARSNTAVVPEG